MLKKTLKLAGIGFLLGVVVGDLITVITSLAFDGGALLFSEELLAATGSQALAFAVQSFLSGVLGAIAWAGISLYDIESWGLLKTAVVHCSIILITYIIVSRILGWGDPGLWPTVMRSGIQVLVYVVIFLIMDARYRREVEQLNELLEESDKSKEK